MHWPLWGGAPAQLSGYALKLCRPVQYLSVSEETNGTNSGVSQPREPPPQLLSEPGVNLSIHRAPIVPTEKDPLPVQ